MNIDDEIKYHIENKSPVEIYYNDDIGKWLWSVQVVGTELWLDSFKEKCEAINFCKENGLKIKRIYSE